ncbi:hypothetical protein JG687_00014212, partial [Phytophthora cactorum]
EDVFDGFVLNSDAAYGVQRFIVSGFKKVQSTEGEHAFNEAMGSVCGSVEREFSILKTQSTSRKKNTLRQGPIGKLVVLCTLLTNYRCFYYGGNKISNFFNL